MKRLLLMGCTLFAVLVVNAQLLTWSPAFPKDNDNIVITVDATKGNQGLLNFTGPVYVHIGAITNLSSPPNNWVHSQFTWGSTESAAIAPPAGTNKWSFNVNNPRAFFGLATGEQIKAIAILFRQGNCSNCQAQRNADGSDMFVPIYDNSLAVRITNPIREPKLTPTLEPITKVVGDAISINALSSAAANLKIYFNNTVIQTANNATAISANPTITATGTNTIVAEADNGTGVKRDTIQFYVSSPITVAPLPAGVKEGINYINSTTVTLVLNAPLKNSVSVIGEFPGSNWAAQSQYQMNKTPDGKYWWLQISGLNPGTEYAYQYLVDGSLKVADPYAEKILETSDQGIPAATYPNLKAYPAGQSGVVSVLQTAETQYNWSVSNFNKPDKRGLVIYEMLVRDFVAAHDWKTIRDTLNYLKKLGVNAIEVMPFNEFGGNDSWGYNPDFYFAPDKYYGPKNTLKEFIDSCHKKGIAVIMDIVLNHTYGSSPLAQLYWDGVNNRPAANNPWYNAVQPHAFGFGDDFNHSSVDTKYFFSRVLQHWINEYKIDGYRFDFSKGLTQKSSTTDAGFSAYDATRIAIISNYYNNIRAANPDTYLILEHFCDNQEEKQLSDSGIMLWANVWTQYQEASMGFVNTSNLDWGVYTSRTWTNPGLVTFMESHDEERVTYKNIKYGNASGGYNIQDTATALKRMELNAAFLLCIPGPKMIWEFGEMGYDYSRCYLATNGEGGDCNTKLNSKPIRWDYLNDNRRKSVVSTYTKLNTLRFHPLYKDAFMTGAISKDLAPAFKWISVNSGDSSKFVVVGNFGVTAVTGAVTFTGGGTWYDYLNNVPFATTGTSQNITLAPGEFKVITNRNINNLNPTPVNSIAWNGTEMLATTYPNPVFNELNVAIKMPQAGKVTIQLYNAIGQDYGMLYHGFLTAGDHNLPFKVKDIAKGNYYLSIKSPSATKTIQVIFQ